MESKSNRPERFHHSLPIPTRKVAWVIGKNGSYLKQLQEKSGATISISESLSSEFGTAWKCISIYGTGRSVDVAKKLIYVRLDRFNFVEAKQGPESVSALLAEDAADVDDIVTLPSADPPQEERLGTEDDEIPHVEGVA